MVYVTGNMHGDKTRFAQKNIKKLKKRDTLIICGDFGFVWDDSPEEAKLLKWIGKRRYKILVVDGTHENYSLLEKFPEVELFGGRVRQLGKNLYQCIRGEIYEIEGLNIFSFGGGSLDDEEEEIEGTNWMVGEEITEEQKENGRKNLARYDNKVDYIVTHDPPSGIKEFMTIQDEYIHQKNTYLDEVSETVDFNKWFFGRQHVDKIISSKFVSVYKDVMNLEPVDNK